MGRVDTSRDYLPEHGSVGVLIAIYDVSAILPLEHVNQALVLQDLVSISTQLIMATWQHLPMDFFYCSRILLTEFSEELQQN